MTNITSSLIPGLVVMKILGSVVAKYCIVIVINICIQIGNYFTQDYENKMSDQPSGPMGTSSPPTTLHCLQNPKWPPGAPKQPTGSFGCSNQLSLFKFLI